MLSTTYENTKEYQYYNTIEAPCAPIFYDMSSRGIRIDLNYLNDLKLYLNEQMCPVEAQIKNELGPINLNSPKQLLEALHAKEIKPEYKNKASTDKRALERLKGNPLIDRLLFYSELSTLLSNFVVPYLERGQNIIHPHFNQCGTRTGRPSCSNPNLLQIPRRTENGKLVRRMFIARTGYLLGDCDFGQIEPRLLAHLSKDATLCGMFQSGIDFHTFTAEKLSIDRDKAKILNLSVGYRATFKSVSQQLNCTDIEAQKEIDEWWGLFPQLHEWQNKLIWQSKKDGYCTTLMGRRIKIEGLNEYNKWKREHAQRQLINNICQGSAAEVMKLAMQAVNRLHLVHLLCQIYDEVLFEFNKNEDEEMVLDTVCAIMENSVKLDVPLVVTGNTGMNWGDIH